MLPISEEQFHDTSCNSKFIWASLPSLDKFRSLLHALKYLNYGNTRKCWKIAFRRDRIQAECFLVPQETSITHTRRRFADIAIIESLDSMYSMQPEVPCSTEQHRVDCTPPGDLPYLVLEIQHQELCCSTLCLLVLYRHYRANIANFWCGIRIQRGRKEVPVNKEK